jgi:Leucine-rich repeat (LRR) protein
VRLAQEEKELKEEIASYNTDSKSEDNLKAKIERAKKTNFLNIKDFKITSLPDEVFTLVNLKTLIISGNPIRGLPEKLSNLKELQVLHAANCQIEDGGFPESVASALVELKELNLSQNLLTNVDEFITKFPKLKMVNLSENDIMSIPEDAIYPESLTQINLQKNNLSTIPESFADLPNLKFLRISGNNFDQDMVDAINKQGPAALKKFF